MRVAITGSGGYLAEQLIVRLGSNLSTSFLLGLDIRPRQPRTACPSSFVQFDLTSPWELLRDQFSANAIDTALHLAWQFNPIHDTKRHREIDVQGSENFFRAAHAAGVKRVVYAGSTTALVNARNSERPLTEDDPVSGTPRYLYSKHKAEVDQMASRFMREHPEIEVLILRGAIVIGPHTKNIVSQVTEWPSASSPFLFSVAGADPPMQFLSEEDITEILYRALTSHVTGVFHCGGDGTLRFHEIARILGKRPLPVPAPLLYGLLGLLWNLRLAPFPPGILDLIRYPWVADNSKLKREFGYSPRVTSQEAVASFAAARTARTRRVANVSPKLK
jgi:UDP-glucose 4-epimerase